MLAKEHRLTSNYDFRKVRRQGRNVKTPFFNLRYLKRDSDSSTRFGFVVSTNIDKRAVRRNRVKRVFREAVRIVLPQVKKGFDVVFWIKRRALEADSKEINETVKSALGKAGALRK